LNSVAISTATPVPSEWAKKTMFFLGHAGSVQRPDVGPRIGIEALFGWLAPVIRYTRDIPQAGSRIRLE
jgi:hypothetical protein